MALGKSDGSVIIDTNMDTSGFGKGVNTMKKQVGGLTSAVGKLGLAISAAFAVGKLIKFGKEAIELGSDLQEVQNVVDVTFTTMSDKVDEFAKNAAETAGLSETMAKKFTGTYGAMAKAFGFAEVEAFNMSTSLTQLAGDVASLYNLTPDEAYTKLKSVFTGETETLKDLGVVMTQNALDSYAMAKGYGKTTSKMSEQEKVALRYSFVLDQLSSAQGDFARTSDSWANQTRILSLNFDSFKANIGQALINIFTPFLKVINQIVSKMAQLSSYFVAFSEMLVGKSTSGGGGSPGEALAEISSGYDAITDSTNEAAKAQKKYLSGLDEIRTFTEDSSTSDSVSSIGGINTLDVNASTNGNTKELEEVENFIDRIKQKMQEFIDKFPVLNNVISIVKNSFELWKKIANDLFDLLTKPITDNKDGLLLAAQNIANFVLSIIERVIVGFDAFMQKLNSVYDEQIHPVISDITNDISELVGKFLNWFNNDMAPVLDRWGEKFDVMWTEHIDPFLGRMAGFFGDIAQGIGYLWNEHIEPFIDWFVSDALPYLTPAIEKIGDIFIDTVGIIADIMSYLLDILIGVIKYIVGTFTGDWRHAWEGIKDILIGVVNIMITAIEDFINNRIISMINGAIDSINLLGGYIGVNVSIPNIPKVNLPKLATGAVIPPNAPFMAVLGDQRHGNNIETPEALLRKVVREESGNGNNGFGVIHNVVQINRRTLLEEMIEEAKLRQSTTGRNPFEL